MALKEADRKKEITELKKNNHLAIKEKEEGIQRIIGELEAYRQEQVKLTNIANTGKSPNANANINQKINQSEIQSKNLELQQQIAQYNEELNILNFNKNDLQIVEKE